VEFSGKKGTPVVGKGVAGLRKRVQFATVSGRMGENNKGVGGREKEKATREQDFLLPLEKAVGGKEELPKKEKKREGRCAAKDEKAEGKAWGGTPRLEVISGDKEGAQKKRTKQKRGPRSRKIKGWDLKFGPNVKKNRSGDAFKKNARTREKK